MTKGEVSFLESIRDTKIECLFPVSALYWDVPSSTIIKRFSGHTGRINSVAFNGESSVLASASFDATVRLWDLRSQQGRPIQVLQEARDSVTCVLLGDREIVASSVDGHVRSYDLRVGELRADFFDREQECFSRANCS